MGIARRVEKIEEIAKKLKLEGKPGQLFAFKADLRKESDIVAAFEWTTKNVGPVQILINNAGVIEPTNLINGNTELWQKTFDINVLAICIASREAINIIKTNNIEGHIVNINSVTGHKTPNLPGFNVYPASKYAVTALTESLRFDVNREGLKIRVTVIIE